jgi:formylglycine-generating enzyme required for sulfatase activity
VVAAFGGTATAVRAFQYLTWYSVLEQNPDPAVVTNPALRSAILATGLPWRVRDNASQIEMLLVPPGTFDMGCSPSIQNGCRDDESPVRTVVLTSAFYIGRYEVTQAQWTARMGANPSFFSGQPDSPTRPVENVSWITLQGFLAAGGLRLPTEAEWEYACRAGSATAFHASTTDPTGTNDDARVGIIAWFSGNSGNQTRPVGQRAPNSLGLHDMSGNVWEWVNDWYAGDAYASGSSTNPQGPPTGTDRLLRGGAFVGLGTFLRASARYPYPPEGNGGAVGFRVARNP